jgi:hypothetical protein
MLMAHGPQRGFTLVATRLAGGVRAPSHMGVAVAERHMEHRRQREPVDQDHQSQACQVSAVSGIQQGGGGLRRGKGLRASLSLFFRPRKTPFVPGALSSGAWRGRHERE